MSIHPKKKFKGNSRTRVKSGSVNRKRAIAGISIMVIGVLLLLSVVSYSPADEAVVDVSIFELWKVFKADEVIKAKADQAQNWLSLAGAIISYFLINTAFGYTVVIIPLLLIVWGWYILRNKELKGLILFTNYSIVFIVLAATFFGLIRLIGDVPSLQMTWSGSVGDFVALAISQIIGVAGSLIVIFALLVVTLIFAIDLDVQKSIERMKQQYARLHDSLGRIIRRRKELKEERRRVKMEARQKEKLSQEPVIITPSGEREIYEKIPSHKQTEKISADEDYKEMHIEKDRIPEEKVELDNELELRIKERVREEELPKSEDVGRRIAEEDEEEEIDYVFPSVELLDASAGEEDVDKEELKTNADLLRAKLANFGVEIERVSVTPGPVLTLYELVPAAGVKISRIVSLADDLALALQAKGIRILAPIPGKGAVGVEIPNNNPQVVKIRSILNSKKFHETKYALPMAMGKTISGEVFIDDLSRLPHLLIAGSTGSGKSVGINTIITSFLYRLHPSDIKFIIIDPKKIELTQYTKLERHYLAVSPDINEKIATTPQSSVTVLRNVEIAMEKRYDILASAGVRNIQEYNERLAAGRIRNTEQKKHKKLPYIIVIIDELADLMLTAAKDVEEPIARLAQLARATGIHLILATQRPSVDVITGVIKANFSARIAYQVASKTDSRTILDMNGAEQLLGNGDMLYLPSGSPKPIRMQNAFISADEVERVTDHIKKQQGYSRPYYLPSSVEKKRNGYGSGSEARDELFEEAAYLVVRHQQGSVSLIQRRLKVGYSRAARIIDELEDAGIVGPFDGSKARQVLVETEDELKVILDSLS